MEETVFPPSPSWTLPNILSSREDGCISYGSKTTIVILKTTKNKSPEMKLIRNAHTLKITAVAFAPSNCYESVQNTVVSSAEDGCVKLWEIDTTSALMCHKSHWEQKEEVGSVVSLDWSVANPCYIVSGASNNTLVLWDVLSNTTKKFPCQKNLGITVVSCCPHNEKIVGVGGKNGQVLIIRLTGSGQVLFKLRGHDNRINSLSWCPVPYNIFETDEVYEEFLLASGCQNKEIFIWRAGTNGKCEAKFQVPTSSLSKKDNQYHGKAGKGFSYSVLLWFEPYRIYSSSNFGELIYFDIKPFVAKINTNVTNSEQKLIKQSNFIKLGHCFHTKGLFTISGSPGKPEVVLYKNTEIKSDLKFPNESDCKVIEKPECEHDADLKWEVITPETSSLLWTSAQDRKIVGCELKSSKFHMVANYHSVNNFVYCAVASPHDPNKIAIGAGDGVIRLWNLTDPIDLKIFWQKIKDRIMSLAWHPTKDGLLAYGTSEGRIGLVDTNSNKLPTVFKPGHPQPIYSLSWGPLFTVERAKDWALKQEFDLYAVGDNILSLYSPSELNADPLNLSRIIPFPCKKQTDVCWKPDYSLMAVGHEDGSVSLVEPFSFKIVHTLQMYKKFIKSIAWHPITTYVGSGSCHYHGYFTSGSADNDCDIQVFNCVRENEEVKVKQAATLKGHFGYIESVAWCPHTDARLVSSSADYSVQIWDVIFQVPLVNFVPSGMALFSIFSPVDPDFILTGCKTEALHVWKASAQTKVCPSVIQKPRKQKKEKSAVPLNEEASKVSNGESVTENEIEVVPVAEAVAITKNSKESKMFSKICKEDANSEFETIYALLKSDGKDDRNYTLPFLGSEEDFRESVLAEEESLKKSNNRTEFYELALWKGNIKEVLEEKIKSGQLNEFLVSLAPIVSPRVWQEACLSYSKTLLEEKMYRKAATYLMACHKVYEAIQVLLSSNLYPEALCIARSRLPKSDPLLKSIVGEYAEWLCKNGSLLKACECYLYLEEYLEVAKICGRKSQAEYLSLAALAARKCGSDSEALEATKAIYRSLERNNFQLAKRICSDHENFKHLSLLLNVYHTMYQLDVGKFDLKQNIISHVRETFECENVIFPSSLPDFFDRYVFYTNKYKVLRITAEELSRAVCSFELEEVLTRVIKALSICSRYSPDSDSEDQLLYKLCVWLVPLGFLNGIDIVFLKNFCSSPKVKSVRAFICAALVKHISFKRNTDEVLMCLDGIDQLKEDLFDAESCAYFRTLTEFEACESRFRKNYSKLLRMTSRSGRIFAGTGKCANAATEDSDLVISDEMNGENAVENGFSESDGQQSQSVGNTRDLESSEDRELSLRETWRDDVAENRGAFDECAVTEVEDQSVLENEVERDVQLLESLRLKKNDFEKERIAAPDPRPLCATLKKVCENLPEYEIGESLLEYLEKISMELN